MQMNRILRVMKHQLIGTLIMTLLLQTNALAAVEKRESPQSILRIGSQTRILPLDPFHTYETLSVHLLDVVFNKLVRLNNKGEMEPDLAETWTISADGKEYTFILKEEIYFHDKTPFSAADVVASYQAYIAPEVGYFYKNVFEKVSSVSAPNSKTVVFQLKEPYAPFLFDLKQFYILPLKIAQDIPKVKNFDYKPIGTGPFYFDQLFSDEKLMLKKYPYYHEGAAQLDQIVMERYASSEGVWAALLRNEIDVIFFLNEEDFKVIEKDNTFKAISVTSSPAYYALALNHTKPLFADKRFRQALSYALDRETLIERGLNGYGRESLGPFLRGSWAEDPNLSPFPYNPKKAIQLLNQMGYYDKDQNGILEKEGKELEIEIKFHNTFEERTKIVYLIRQYLQEIGVKVYLKPEHIGESNFEKAGESFFDIEFQIIKSHPEPSLAVLGWHSETGDLGQYYSFKNESLDHFIEMSSSEFSPELRRRYFYEIGNLLHEEQPMLFLFFKNDFYALRDNFIDVDELFNFFLPFHTLKDWAQKSSAR